MTFGRDEEQEERDDVRERIERIDKTTQDLEERVKRLEAQVLAEVREEMAHAHNDVH